MATIKLDTKRLLGYMEKEIGSIAKTAGAKVGADKGPVKRSGAKVGIDKSPR